MPKFSEELQEAARKMLEKQVREIFYGESPIAGHVYEPVNVPTPWTLMEAQAYLNELWPTAGTLPPINEGCDHEFKPYYGFTHSYKFCKKCDHKEPLE